MIRTVPALILCVISIGLFAACGGGSVEPFQEWSETFQSTANMGLADRAAHAVETLNEEERKDMLVSSCVAMFRTTPDIQETRQFAWISAITFPVPQSGINSASNYATMITPSPCFDDEEIRRRAFPDDNYTREMLADESDETVGVGGCPTSAEEAYFDDMARILDGLRDHLERLDEFSSQLASDSALLTQEDWKSQVHEVVEGLSALKVDILERVLPTTVGDIHSDMQTVAEHIHDVGLYLIRVEYEVAEDMIRAEAKGRLVRELMPTITIDIASFCVDS